MSLLVLASRSVFLMSRTDRAQLTQSYGQPPEPHVLEVTRCRRRQVHHETSSRASLINPTRDRGTSAGVNCVPVAPPTRGMAVPQSGRALGICLDIPFDKD